MDAMYGDVSSPKFILEGINRRGIVDINSLLLCPTDLAVENRDTVLVPNPSIGPTHGYGLVGAINGVLCLEKIDDNNFYVFALCNPLTGQMMETNSHARETEDGINYLTPICF